MKQHHASPDNHWSWTIPVTHRHGVRSGDMVWIGGQMDVSAAGGVRNPGNLAAQVKGCVENIERVLAALGARLDQAVKLLCFYVNDGSVDEDGFLRLVAAALPTGTRPAVTAIPTPYLAWPGVAVEIEAYAMLGADNRPLPRTHATPPGLTPLPEPFTSAIRCGKMIFVSGQSAVDEKGRLLHAGDILSQTRQVMAQVRRALADYGAGFSDVVKINRWYVGKGTTEDFEPAALECAANFAKPGPAATGVPIPRHARGGQLIKIEVVAMLGEDGSHLPRRHVWPDTLWGWTVDFPYWHGLKCHDMIFLGGQVSLDTEGRAVNSGKMRAQTGQAMVHIGSILRELGADYPDVCKLTTVYANKSGTDELNENLRIRSAFFAESGPATTDIPLPVLAYPGMIIEIDCFAMAEPDKI